MGKLSRSGQYLGRQPSLDLLDWDESGELSSRRMSLMSEHNEFISSECEEENFKVVFVQDLTAKEDGEKNSFQIDKSKLSGKVSEVSVCEMDTQEEEKQQDPAEERLNITRFYLETLFPEYPKCFAAMSCVRRLDSVVKLSRVIGERDKVATGKLESIFQSNSHLVQNEITWVLGIVRQRVHPQFQSRPPVLQQKETSELRAAEDGHI